jgi:hypothetical protein
MGRIGDEILRAAKVVNATISEVPMDRARIIRASVVSKFASGTTTWPIWEHLTEQVAVQDADAWMWVGDYVGNNRTVILFNEVDETAMFEFEDGSQVVPVISESFLFEFYLTNPTSDYLISHNHHDFLIAAGSAISWLKDRIGESD